MFPQVDYAPPTVELAAEDDVPPPPLASPKFSADIQRQLDLQEAVPPAAAVAGSFEEANGEVIVRVPNAPAPKCAPPCAPAMMVEPDLVPNPHAGWQMVPPPFFQAPADVPPPPAEAPKDFADEDERLSPCAWECSPPPCFDAHVGEVPCH